MNSARRSSQAPEVSVDDITHKQQNHDVPSILLSRIRGSFAAPGDHRVVTDEELIEGLSFTASRRISTVIFVPAEAGYAVEMIAIDPMDLQAVHEQDVAMLAVCSVVGRPTNTAAC